MPTHRKKVSWESGSLKLTLLLLLTILTLVPAAFSQSTLSITVNANKGQYSVGESVLISGNVHDAQGNPVFGAGVSIQVNDPGQSFVHVQLLLTDQSGAYSDQFTLLINADQGQYTIYVTASQSGYSNGQSQAQFSVSSATTSSSSSAATGTSNKCLIATATYGSELAPEVTLLRNFRDLDILQTSAGERFMRVFNAFYYSFSPGVASFVASNGAVKSGMRIALYPLIGILHVSKFVFGALSFNSEVAVIIAGILASIAIGAVYIGPPLTALSRLIGLRSASQYVKGVCLASVFVLSSVAGLSLAELIKNTLWLEMTTVGTVLSNIVLGAVVVSWTVTRALSQEP